MPRIRASLTTLIFLLAASQLFAQSPPDPDCERKQVFGSYEEFRATLNLIAGIANAQRRESELDTIWDRLKDAGQVPYAQGEQFAFLYRGDAASVSFAGDFNGWNPSTDTGRATKLGETDLWICVGTLPADARTDYKVVVDNQWILDPANPLQMWSGLGSPNSELRMPEYKYPRETVRDPAVPRGSLSDDITIASKNLGYDVNYRVYTPAGYTAESLRDLPVVYVADGHEYLADHLGSMVIVLDNLIAAGKLRPTIAVFIDPREQGNPANNRRISEYGMNPKFANFVAEELVPAIDRAYRTEATADGRTILGTSMGGLNAAYLGAVKPDVFGNIAPQSPAYNQNAGIYSIYEKNDLRRLKIFQTNGTLGNDRLGADKMADVWNAHSYKFTSIVANEGHSWGQWRGQLDEILISLIGSRDDMRPVYNTPITPSTSSTDAKQ